MEDRRISIELDEVEDRLEEFKNIAEQLLQDVKESEIKMHMPMFVHLESTLKDTIEATLVKDLQEIEKKRWESYSNMFHEIADNSKNGWKDAHWKEYDQALYVQHPEGNYLYTSESNENNIEELQRVAIALSSEHRKTTTQDSFRILRSPSHQAMVRPSLVEVQNDQLQYQRNHSLPSNQACCYIF